MICVSIGRARHKMMKAEHRALAEAGAELVELRLDWLSRTPNLKRLLDGRPTPVVITCRRASERGKWQGTEDQRLTLLRQAIVDGADYVDLEMDIASKIPRYGPTRRIVSYHNFDGTPDDLEQTCEAMRELDPDVIKIACMANSPLDNVRVLKLVEQAPVPTVGFCMGELGVPSRVLCGRCGAPFTYATFSSERVLAPGQLSFAEMRDVYRYGEINARTRVFGVLGDPIGHSYSPLVHNAAFREAGLNAVYLPFRVPKEALVDTLREFEHLGIEGYSVTIPHKEAVVDLCRYKDDSVLQIGAANTLYQDEQGRWCATNTDYEAALQTIRLGLAGMRARPASGGAADGGGGSDPDKECHGVSESGSLGVSRSDSHSHTPAPPSPQLTGRKVLILGAGGVAKAIALGVARAGAVVTVTNRDRKRGKQLAELAGCQFVNWENRPTVLADILINCTPVGMHPRVDETPYDREWLREGMLVFDTVYNPEQTRLLAEAREHNCYTVSGLEMFVLQAAAQFECFIKQPAPLEVMRETLRRGIAPARRPEGAA